MKVINKLQSWLWTRAHYSRLCHRSFYFMTAVLFLFQINLSVDWKRFVSHANWSWQASIFCEVLATFTTRQHELRYIFAGCVFCRMPKSTTILLAVFVTCRLSSDFKMKNIYNDFWPGTVSGRESPGKNNLRQPRLCYVTMIASNIKFNFVIAPLLLKTRFENVRFNQNVVGEKITI